MKRQAYLSYNETIQLLKVGLLAGEMEIIADETPDKDWKRKLKCVKTYCQNIFNERLKILDAKTLHTLQRRTKNTRIVISTMDKRRISEEDGKPEAEVTVATDALFAIVDHALLSCTHCKGRWIKDCQVRRAMHEWGVPPLNTEPKDLMCEYCYGGNPDNIDERYEQLMLENSFSKRL